MKYLLTGAAVVAALAFSAPLSAQPASPSGGNAVGMPGPNPGGPGLTPYSGGAPKPSYTPPTAPPAAMAPSAPSYESSSATPPSYPSHHHPHHAYHAKAGYHHGKAYPVTGGNADQLNQEELARLQAGNYSNPPAPSYNPPPPGRGYSPPPPATGYNPPPPAPYTPMGGGTSPYHP
jgi:hypothetical protein